MNEQKSSVEQAKSQEEILSNFERTFLVSIGRPDHMAENDLQNTQPIAKMIEHANNKRVYREDLIERLRDKVTSKGMESIEPAEKVELAKLLDEAKMEALHAFSRPEEGWRIKGAQVALERYEQNPVDSYPVDAVKKFLADSKTKPTSNAEKRIFEALSAFKDVPQEARAAILTYLDQQMVEANQAADAIRESAKSKMLPKEHVEGTLKAYENTYAELEKQKDEIKRLIGTFENKA